MSKGAERNTEFGIVQVLESKTTYYLPSHKATSEKDPSVWRKVTV